MYTEPKSELLITGFLQSSPIHCVVLQEFQDLFHNNSHSSLFTHTLKLLKTSQLCLLILFRHFAHPEKFHKAACFYRFKQKFRHFAEPEIVFEYGTIWKAAICEAYNGWPDLFAIQTSTVPLGHHSRIYILFLPQHTLCYSERNQWSNIDIAKEISQNTKAIKENSKTAVDSYGFAHFPEIHIWWFQKSILAIVAKQTNPYMVILPKCIVIIQCDWVTVFAERNVASDEHPRTFYCGNFEGHFQFYYPFYYYNW